MSEKNWPNCGDVVYGPLECWDPRDRGVAYIVDDVQSSTTTGTIHILKLLEHSKETDCQYWVSCNGFYYNGEYWQCDTEPQLYQSTSPVLHKTSEGMKPGEMSTYVAGNTGKSLSEYYPNARLMSAASVLYNVLFEIIHYDGGADSALHDEYLVGRALEALAMVNGIEREI